MLTTLAENPKLTTCSVCSKPAQTYLVFDELAGCPRVCGQCLYHAISGKRIDFLPVRRP